MKTFAERCRERHAAGIARYRGCDASRPFEGDPIEEGVQETVDLANYADAAQRAGRLSPSTSATWRSAPTRSSRLSERSRLMTDRTTTTKTPDLAADDELSAAQAGLGQLWRLILAATDARLIGERRFRQLRTAIEIAASLLGTAIEDAIEDARRDDRP